MRLYSQRQLDAISQAPRAYGVSHYLHVSPRSNRDSIRAQGLLPHKPDQDGNWSADRIAGYPRSDYGFGVPDLSFEPRGVYVIPVAPGHLSDPVYREDAQYNRLPVPGHEGEPFDHWLVDATGLSVVEDEGEFGGDVILDRVPPERLTLLDDDAR